MAIEVGVTVAGGSGESRGEHACRRVAVGYGIFERYPKDACGGVQPLICAEALALSWPPLRPVTVHAIKRALQIPVLTNGNVRCASDIGASLQRTRADGAMVAEALLRYPGVMAPEAPERPTTAARRQMVREYIALALAHPPPDVSYVRAHLLWQLGRDGSGARLRFKFLPRLHGPTLRDRLVNAESAEALLEVCMRAWEAHDAHERLGSCEVGAPGSEEVCQVGQDALSQRAAGVAEREDLAPPPSTAQRTVAFWRDGVIVFGQVPCSALDCHGAQ